MKHIRFERNERNIHGTQKKGEPWNRETVRGPRFSVVDIRKGNPHTKENANDFYKRIIFYFPSGAWWNLDIFFPRREASRIPSV